MVSIYIDSRSPRIFHSSIRCIFLETLGTLGLLRAAGSSFLMQLFCWCKLLFVLYPDPWHFYGSNVWSALQIRGHFQDDAAIKWPLKRKIRLVISTRVILVWRALGKIFENANAKMRTKGCVNHRFFIWFKIRDKNSFLKNKEVKSEKLLWWVSSAGRKIIDIIFAERPLIIEKNK